MQLLVVQQPKGTQISPSLPASLPMVPVQPLQQTTTTNTAAGNDDIPQGNGDLDIDQQGGGGDRGGHGQGEQGGQRGQGG